MTIHRPENFILNNKKNVVLRNLEPNDSDREHSQKVGRRKKINLHNTLGCISS